MVEGLLSTGPTPSDLFFLYFFLLLENLNFFEIFYNKKKLRIELNWRALVESFSPYIEKQRVFLWIFFDYVGFVWTFDFFVDFWIVFDCFDFFIYFFSSSIFFWIFGFFQSY